MERKFKDLKGNIYTFISFEEKAIDTLKHATHIDHCMHAKAYDKNGRIVYINALNIEFI